MRNQQFRGKGESTHEESPNDRTKTRSYDKDRYVSDMQNTLEGRPARRVRSMEIDNEKTGNIYYFIKMVTPKGTTASEGDVLKATEDLPIIEFIISSCQVSARYST